MLKRVEVGEEIAKKVRFMRIAEEEESEGEKPHDRDSAWKARKEVSAA